MSQGFNSDRRRFAQAAGGLVALQGLAACGSMTAASAPAPVESRLFALLVEIDRSKAGPLVPQHVAWLDKKFKDGVYLVSGELGARGFALFTAPNQAAADALMADEPFTLGGAVKQQILEFNPRFINAAFAPIARHAGASKTTEFAVPIAPGNLFVMLVDIVAVPAEFEKLLPTHIPWLESRFKAGAFAGSGGLGQGPKALAFVRASSPQAAHAWLAEDPLVKNKAVKQELIQFKPRTYNPAFAAVVAGAEMAEARPAR